jgi:glycosyltransferase involved in cell wall biosynthesis
VTTVPCGATVTSLGFIYRVNSPYREIEQFSHRRNTRGFPVALQALRHVPGTLILVVVGPLLEPLKRLARRLGVADRVVFAGNLPHYLDLVPYHLAADASWFPSNARSEGFGIV